MKVAVCTMVYNEEVFLRIWSRYYSGAVGPENLFVIDHGTDDGSTECLPRATNLIRIPRSSFDELARVALVNAWKDGLLRYYDVVIYTDCDEIIVPDPDIAPGLIEYLRMREHNVIAPVGLNMFHFLGHEEPFDRRKLVLHQRRYCRYASSMCKPTITRVPLAWAPGFHNSNKEAFHDHQLYHFHLKSLDRDLMLSRLKVTRAMRWAESNLEKNMGRHQRESDEWNVSHFLHEPSGAAEKGVAEFEFQEETKRLEESREFAGGLYWHKIPDRKIVRIPDRFRDIF